MSRSRINPWLLFGLGTTVVMFWATRGKASEPTQSVSSNMPRRSLPELPGSMAQTAGQIQNAATLWSQLSPVQPLDSGYINFPSGSQAAAATFASGNTRMDAQGNYYVQWGGLTYQLGSQDGAGNWPAQVVG